MDWNTVAIFVGVAGGGLGMVGSLVGWGYTLGVQSRRMDEHQRLIESIETTKADNERLQELYRRVTALEGSSQAQTITLGEIKATLAGLKEGVEWIKAMLGERHRGE